MGITPTVKLLHVYDVVHILMVIFNSEKCFETK